MNTETETDPTSTPPPLTREETLAEYRNLVDAALDVSLKILGEADSLHLLAIVQAPNEQAAKLCHAAAREYFDRTIGQAYDYRAAIRGIDPDLVGSIAKVTPWQLEAIRKEPGGAGYYGVPKTPVMITRVQH